MIKLLSFIRGLFSREVPAARAANQPEITWFPVEFEFDVDWYVIGGEDYLHRINVPAPGSLVNPDSVAFTDLVNETSRKSHHLCSDHVSRADQTMQAPLWGSVSSGRGVCELCRREGRFRRNA